MKRVQRSELLAACVVGLVAALLYVLGDSSFLEGLIGVAVVSAIVLIWFWGWRRYYESDWPQRTSTSRLRYVRVLVWALAAGGGAAWILELLGFGEAVRITAALFVMALVAVLEAGAVREELRVSRYPPSGR